MDENVRLDGWKDSKMDIVDGWMDEYWRLDGWWDSKMDVLMDCWMVEWDGWMDY